MTETYLITEFLKETIPWMFSGIGIVAAGFFFRQTQRLRQILFQRNAVSVVHNSFPIDEIKRKIASAKQRVLILDSWLARPDAIPDALKESLSRNPLDVKILVLGGQGANEILKNRMHDLESKIRYPSDMSDQVIHQISEWPTDLRRKIHIHSFCATPPFAMYLIDNCVYLGIFWHTKISSMGPFLQIVEGSILFEHIVETFFKIWDKRSVDYFLTYKTEQKDSPIE